MRRQRIAFKTWDASDQKFVAVGELETVACVKLVTTLVDVDVAILGALQAVVARLKMVT